MKDNFRCIDALDEASKPFKDLHITIEDANKLIKERFDNNTAASSDDFDHDLP